LLSKDIVLRSLVPLRVESSASVPEMNC